MYRSCLFCSADLGANEMLEEFPVGQSLAFDGERGRLWAVCRRCSRWNLAPIEERWEALESAEKLFRDARLRVHSENIGLAKLPDGTRLIRIGEALAGELAAWRYGSQLVQRRRRYFIGAGAVVGVGALAAGGLWAAGAMVGAMNIANFGNMMWQHRQSKKLVHHVAAEDSPTGEPLWLRRYQLHGARVARDDAGAVSLVLPEALVPRTVVEQRDPDAWRLVLRGTTAETVLNRTIVFANRSGARTREVGDAIQRLTEAGSAEAYLARLADRDVSLGVPRLYYYGHRVNAPSLETLGTRWKRFTGTFRGEIAPYRKISAAEASRLGQWVEPHWTRGQKWHEAEKRNRLQRAEALALEMALHEESERRALEGELWLLERAWREAEEIAAIADALPDDPLDRIRSRIEEEERT
jgi:hypothetical protein